MDNIKDFKNFVKNINENDDENQPKIKTVGDLISFLEKIDKTLPIVVMYESGHMGAFPSYTNIDEVKISQNVGITYMDDDSGDEIEDKLSKAVVINHLGN